MLTLVLATCPALALLYYYYRQDRFRPEPKVAILLVFLAGGASTALAYGIELVLDGAAHHVLPPARWPTAFAALEAFFVAGLVEEGLKLLTVLGTIYRRPVFDEVTDGIVYTIVASLGFACLENLRYFWSTHDRSVLLLRGLTAVPMHAFVSGLMGFEVGLSRFADGARARRLHLLRGLVLAAALHGFYDFCLMTQVLGLVALVVPLLVFEFLLLRARFRTALALDLARLGPSLAPYRPWRVLPGMPAAAAAAAVLDTSAGPRDAS